MKWHLFWLVICHKNSNNAVLLCYFAVDFIQYCVFYKYAALENKFM